MSSIDLVNKRVIWTDNNYLGLHDKWVAELRAEGYEVFDRRKMSNPMVAKEVV